MSCEPGGTADVGESSKTPKSSPESDLGRISGDLLSQDRELQELKGELVEVNKAFDSFRNDYSQLLTLYNGTNDELQALLHERSLDTGKQDIGTGFEDTMQQALEMRGKCREAEIERDKYREMYLEAVRTPVQNEVPIRLQCSSDSADFKEQIRDMAEQLQELEQVRQEMAVRLQCQAGERNELLVETEHLKELLQELNHQKSELSHGYQLAQEQLSVKNTVIEKLRGEFSELGEENTNLASQVRKLRERDEKKENLLNSANVNQEDIARDFQAVHYRCNETEKREQEALLYIKDCLKLVEQTQHEKEQLVMQAAQSESLRIESEGTISCLVEEASRRTRLEVTRVRDESNKKILCLISENGGYQERVAELEAHIEELERQRELNMVSCDTSREDTVALADKDAVIYKLRDHVNKLSKDKTSLTDQLLEVSNTLRASKEHFQTKNKSLEYHFKSTKDKLIRTIREKEALIEDNTSAKSEIESLQTTQRVQRSKVVELQSVIVATERRAEEQLREVQEEEERKREEQKRAKNKLVESLRQQLLLHQDKIKEFQEQQTQSLFIKSQTEGQLNTTVHNLTKKLKEQVSQQREASVRLERVRAEQEHEREKAFKKEARLRAVDMQLTTANNQIAHVTENEARFCSKIKELQLKIDQLEFDRERSVLQHHPPGNVLNHSSAGNYITIPTAEVAKSRQKHSRKQEKRDRKEKDKISKIFSNQISSRTDRSRTRHMTSTPAHTDHSDTTIKFTDNEALHEPDISRISEQEG